MSTSTDLDVLQGDAETGGASPLDGDTPIDVRFEQLPTIPRHGQMRDWVPW